jgi:hypothetical protein
VTKLTQTLCETKFHTNLCEFHKKKVKLPTYIIVTQAYVILGLSNFYSPSADIDDLNDVMVSNADCQSKDPGFESQVSHGPFQKV